MQSPQSVLVIIAVMIYFISTRQIQKQNAKRKNEYKDLTQGQITVVTPTFHFSNIFLPVTLNSYQ